MDYPSASEFIESLINYERTLSWQYPEALKLDRMKALAKEFGNPQNAYESAIIAGSKGKGSTAAFLSSILRMEDYRVGLYISPHLITVRERIQVNGQPVSEARFAEYATRLEKILQAYEWKKDPPTYFEALTVMAFHHFKELKVHAAVLEVGLGGLYDSTNIAPAKVVGLAPIGLEHTDKLGKTVAKIAVQKCGIIKGRETVVSAPQSKEAEAVIQKTVEEREARLIRVYREIRIEEREHGEVSQSFDLKTPFGDYFKLEVGLLGTHQLENAAAAVGLAKSLESRSFLKISESAIRQGLRDARWPGRLEKIGEHPWVVLDGAQTPESARRLVEALHRHFYFNKLIVVIGVSSDKNLSGILAELEEAATFVATQADTPRAMPAMLVAEALKEAGREAVVESVPAEALEKARTLASKEDLILVTGSLFLVGDIKKALV